MKKIKIDESQLTFNDITNLFKYIYNILDVNDKEIVLDFKKLCIFSSFLIGKLIQLKMKKNIQINIFIYNKSLYNILLTLKLNEIFNIILYDDDDDL